MIIGIVTISYNQGRFLGEAIDSVRLLPPHELEYAIVDPGSRDNSRDIIRSKREIFSSVTFQPDEGPADGLRRGFAQLQRADVCGYINADDCFSPGALNYVCDFFQANPSVDILLGSIQLIDEDGAPMIRSRRVARVTLEALAEQRCAVWQQSTFFRRSAFDSVGGFNLKNRTCWDLELVADMLLAGYCFGYTSRVLGQFRIHQTSLTGSKNSEQQALYRLDQERISEKVYKAGVRRRPRALRAIRSVFDRLNPYRHATNLLIGLSAIVGQR